MSGVPAGSLRNRVRLEQQTYVMDSNGDGATEWALVAEVWANVAPKSAREFIQSAANQSEVRGVMVIRYRGGVNASMRIVHRGMYYNVFGVIPDADSGIGHLTLMTGEGVNLGD